MANVVVHIGYDISFVTRAEDVSKIFALFENAQIVSRRWVNNDECWLKSDKPLVRAETLTGPVYSGAEYEAARAAAEDQPAEV